MAQTTRAGGRHDHQIHSALVVQAGRPDDEEVCARMLCYLQNMSFKAVEFRVQSLF